MLPATRSRGNSSRMIPKQSGKMPPPKPCRTRPNTTVSSEPPSAATSEPTPNTEQREHEHPALAEHVAEAAGDRRRDRGGEQVARQDPGDPARVGVEPVRELAQRGDQHRLRERERQRGDAEDQEAPHRVRAVVVGRHAVLGERRNGLGSPHRSAEPDPAVRFAIRTLLSDSVGGAGSNRGGSVAGGCPGAERYARDPARAARHAAVAGVDARAPAVRHVRARASCSTSPHARDSYAVAGPGRRRLRHRRGGRRAACRAA